MNQNKISAVLERAQKKVEFYTKQEAINKKGLFSDGNTFSNNQRIHKSKDMWFIEISSSLMIPENFLPLLKKKIKKYKSIAGYLSYLLRSNKIHIVNGLIPSYNNVNTKYQEKDQNLKKVGIRAKGSDWGEMQLLRVSHGLSMSAIFVFLLKADSVELAKTVSEFLVGAGIPTILRIDFSGEIHLEGDRFFFGRIFQYEERFG